MNKYLKDIPEGGREKHHDTRVTEQIAHEAANFIRNEAGTQSLITVTRAILTSHGDRVTVFITVFPESEARAALSFLERQRQDFSEHLKKHTKVKPLPRVAFQIDNGELNRQNLDKLSEQL